MNDAARQKLIKLVDSQPPGLMEDSERFEAFLRDYCGECKPEISAILAALQEDVPRDLRRMRGQPYSLLREQLANKLQEDRSLHQEAALWAVESWAMALEIAPGSQRQHGVVAALPPENEVAARTARGQAAPPPPPPPPPPPHVISPPIISPQNVPPPGPPVVVYPRREAAGGGAGPAQPSQPQPVWQAQGWTPASIAPQPPQMPANVLPPQVNVQPWTPPAILPVPPKHNSLLVGGICFAAAIFAYLAGSESGSSGMETFFGVVVLAFALAGAVELMLGLVRFSVVKPQPPGLVASSISFWMKLFAAEDRILNVFAQKQGAQFPAGGPAPYPAPPAPPNFSQAQRAAAQPPMNAPTPAPPQPVASPIGAQAEAEKVFCIACGAMNGAGAIFCLSCGERLYYPGAQQNLGAN